MFETLFASRRKPAWTGSNRVRVSLEQLETRDLLAAVVMIEPLDNPADCSDKAVRLKEPVLVSTSDQKEVVDPAVRVALASSSAPEITNFEAIHESGNLWTFKGQVTGEGIVGRDVVFGGNVSSMEGVTTTIQPDGSFSITVDLMPDEEGTVTAQTTDESGQESNVAEALVRW